MEKTRIYLIRHGESKGNQLSIFLGHTDLDLTFKWVCQAFKTSHYLSTCSIDIIYASDLKRAAKTAKYTSILLDLDINYNSNLREIYAGSWEGRPFAILKDQFKENYHTWLNNIGRAHCNDGESVEHLQIRIVDAIKEIAMNNLGKNIAIFTHATPIRCFASYCLKYSLDDIAKLPWPTNSSATEVEFDGEEFKLVRYSYDDFVGDERTGLPKGV